MDNEKQDTSTPDSNPKSDKGESRPVRNEEQTQPEERLWKHESEIPDSSSESKGPFDSAQDVGSGQRRDSN